MRIVKTGKKCQKYWRRRDLIRAEERYIALWNDLIRFD